MNTPLRALPVLRAAVAASVLWLCGGAAAEEASQNVEAVAKKVEKRAERTEKAEGSKHDLVKDAVRTKTATGGEKVVEQVGEASYYGKGFHGKKTAGGKKFNQGDRTAAHPTLPLGSEAKVTNLETGKSVEVEINDRGPYAKGRDIDLSKAAAKEIGIDKKNGEAPVKIEASVPKEKK
jgi:rare lipoprotein A (peptidoglycan hydrolase)